MNAVIIYSHKDDAVACRLAEKLSRVEGFKVLLVGDTEKFECAAEVLRLKPEKHGIGAALKQAYRYIKEKFKECRVITTITDASNHHAEDVVQISVQAEQNAGALVLGTPKREKGRIRGIIDKIMFSLATGKALKDIHVSLRAFPREMISKFMGLEADGADYEVDMLMQAVREGVKVHEVEISQAKKEAVHDWQKVKSVYISALLFLASSLFAFALEFVLLLGIESMCAPLGQGIALAMAVGISRVVSCIVNYAVNRKIVFKSSSPVGSSMLRYFAVAGFVLVVNYLLLRLCVIGFEWQLWLSKFIVESVLFFVNFALQGKFVYKK